MGSSTFVMFMAVNQKDLTLPIADWMSSNIWQLFDAANANLTEQKSYQLTEKHGHHLHHILKIRDRCHLQALNFLEIDLLENNYGTILQGVELIPVIRSLTIVLDELLSAVDRLSFLPTEDSVNKLRMQQAFDNAKVYHNINLQDYEEEGLFILIKTLLLVANEALINNKIFVYINFTA